MPKHKDESSAPSYVVSTSGSDGSGSDRVYRLLRQAILRHEMPPGADLDEAAISARYDVSRTPVREALIRLTSEELVTSARGRGARVAAMNLADLRDFFEGLDVLQRALTRLAALRRTDEDLKRIREHMQAFEKSTLTRDGDEINATNYHFHAAIGAAAQSGYMQRAYLRNLVEGMRIGHVTFAEHNGVECKLQTHLEATAEDHRIMFEAILNQDPDTAEACAGDHVELFRDRIVSTILSLEPTRAIKLSAR